MGNAVTDFLEYHMIKEAVGSPGLGYAKSVLLRGALPGAALGGGIGALTAEEDRLKGALAGGGAGAVLGAGGAAAADLPIYKMRKHWTDVAKKGKGLMNKATLEGVDAVEDLKRAVGTPYSGQEPLKQEVAEQVSKRMKDADELGAQARRAAEEAEFAEQLLSGQRFEKPGGGKFGVPQFGEGVEPVGPAIGAGAMGGVLGSSAALPWVPDGSEKKPKTAAAFNTKLMGESFQKALSGGLGQLGAGAIMTAGAYGASKAIGAATDAINRSRGYKKMMEIHPDLGERDEQQVKGMYNMLHKAAPTMAMNPYVAGGFIRRTEHASQYVDPKMVADLADAESKIQRSAWGGISEPMRFATGMMPGMSFGGDIESARAPREKD